MGKIIINVPFDIDETFEIADEKKVRQLLEILSGNSRKRIVEEVVGIWKDRFDKKLSSGEVAQKLRKDSWRR